MQEENFKHAFLHIIYKILSACMYALMSIKRKPVMMFLITSPESEKWSMGETWLIYVYRLLNYFRAAYMINCWMGDS